MGASSVTGTGTGASEKVTTTELAILANAPSIIFTGIVESSNSDNSSPPTNSATVVFPYVLPYASSNYVVILTSLNGGYSYVSSKDETGGKFSGFSCITQSEGSAMYLVAAVGSKPIIV